ncbi:MAG: hypothetical protein NTZ90_01505 [Proteobacteria bacterium]|nr:hypothetical protein [Pseudomonadota bacterium]
MQSTPRGLFLLSIVTALCGLLGLSIAYGWYARQHFGPQILLRSAAFQGDGCLLTLGDSRMEAGIDPGVLAASLRGALTAPLCIAPLAIGAVGISGASMALRRYLDLERKPSVVVLGVSAGTLLPDLETVDPKDLFGNRAIELAWSRPSDVWLYYPDFPLSDLDRGLRFWITRSNALSIYASLTWIKVKTLQNALVGTGAPAAGPRERFGAQADMQVLLKSFGDVAMRKLEHFNGGWRFDPWFQQILESTRRSGSRLVLVEVPMPSAYRRDILESTVASSYQTWLRGELQAAGVGFVDGSHPPGVEDGDFSDGLHLGGDGARHFSEQLGRLLAPVISSRAAPKDSRL